jgi:hypothetical protein
MAKIGVPEWNKILDFSIGPTKMTRLQSAGESLMAPTIADPENSEVSKANVDERKTKIPAAWLRKTAVYAAVILTIAPLLLAVYLIREHTHGTFLSLLSR